MGYWIETCFITGLPVKPGDRVVMLAVTPWNGDERDPFQLVTVFLSYLARGEYDGYGKLTDTAAEPTEADVTTVFAREDAWRWVLATYPLPEDVLAGDRAEWFRSVMKRQSLTETDIRELYCVLCYCYSVRVSLYRGAAFKGCQHDDGARALNHAEYVRNSAREYLTRQREEEEYWEDEEEDCDEARLREEGRRDAEHYATLEKLESESDQAAEE